MIIIFFVYFFKAKLYDFVKNSKVEKVEKKKKFFGSKVNDGSAA